MEKHSKNPGRAIALGSIFAMGCWLATAATAQAQVTVVSLGTVSAGVSKEVIVPLLLTPATNDTKVGDISATVSFDSSVVTFLRAEKGFLLAGVNGKIQAELHNNTTEPANSTVDVSVVTEGEPRKPLREGLLLSLIFKINADAPVTIKMPLKFQKLAAATTDNPPKPIDPLTGAPGSIEVLSPESVPYVGCFFFTH
jgi:Cohesin domain